MTALNALAAARAAADVNIEFSVNRLAGNLRLVLLGGAHELDGLATERTFIGQRGDISFVYFFGRFAISNRTVVLAGFPARFFGSGLGRPFGERRSLALLPALESFDESAQLLQIRPHPGNLRFQRLYFGPFISHVKIIVTSRTKNEKYALNNYSRSYHYRGKMYMTGCRSSCWRIVARYWCWQ